MNSVVKDSKPLATLFLFSFNQECYIRQAVLAALGQTYSPLQIIISDDCSSDSTFEVIKSIVHNYSGPHHVTVNRNKKNIGIAEHVNLMFSMAEGELIIASAGDDISVSSRVSQMVTAYLESGRGDLLIHSDARKIDPEGNDLGLLRSPIANRKLTISELACSDRLYLGASAAFSRSLIKRFPPICHKNAFEDLVWGFRAGCLNGLVYIPHPLVLYRVDVGVSSSHRSARYAEELLRSRRKRLARIDVFRQRLEDFPLIFKNCESIQRLLKLKLEFELAWEALSSSSWSIKSLLNTRPKYIFMSAKVELKDYLRWLLKR